MLEYGLVATPESDQRWYIRASEHSPEYRYLVLQRPKKSLFGQVGWAKVHEVMISDYRIKHHGFPAAVRNAAEEVVRDVTVNFNLPTGEVR